MISLSFFQCKEFLADFDSFWKKLQGIVVSCQSLQSRDDTTSGAKSHLSMSYHIHMAVASGPAGPVLAGPVLTLAFKTAHAQGYVIGRGSARAAALRS